MFTRPTRPGFFVPEVPMSAEIPKGWHWLSEAELRPFDPSAPLDPTADDAGNVAAFLDMLAHAEGTRRYGDEDGYNVIVGGGLFHDYRDHPRKSVYLPAYEIRSTAAGRYQFLVGTWDDLVQRFGLADFSPVSQDAAAVQLIRQCKALALVRDGRVREAIHACRRIWASLPGAGYGQRELATDELVEVYRAAGGNVAGN
jgi:muramidase (phage lysozyme)